MQKAIENLGLEPLELLDFTLKKEAINGNKKTVRLREVIDVYEAFSNLNYPAIATKIGQHISCGDYGLYGCTLLCKSSLEDTLNFSIKYHSLVTRTTRLYLDKWGGPTALYGCADIFFRPDITDFNLELQISINLTLIREVLGNADYAPVRVYYSFKKPEHHQVLQEIANCEVCFGSDFTGIELRKTDLHVAPSKSNPLAIPLLLKICDEHKLDFLHQNEVVERVYNWVSQNIHNELKIEKIAEELCISERTLRRKLSESGTSFSSICITIKQGFAKKYIRETQLSFDDIAESLGFRETSNFRHAFKSWTGITPSEYRKQVVVAD